MEQEYKYMVVTRCFTFNHASYIVDAMNGFTMQETTFPVVTCIVDDASTDGEQEVIRQYLVDHFHAPYREKETEDYILICANHKINANCQFVVFLLKYNHYNIKKSKFPYLSEWLDKAKYHAICEGDDYWIKSDKLQKQVNYMEHNSNVGLLYTNINMYHVAEDRTSYSFFSTQKRIMNTHDDFIMHAWFIAPCTWLYRSSIIIKKPNLNENIFFTGDTLIYLTISKYSDVHYMSEVTSVYRVLNVSASHFQSHKDECVFWRKVSNTRIYFARHKSITFRLKLWKEMVNYQRPSIKKHRERLPSWMFESLRLFFLLFLLDQSSIT